MSLIKYLKFCIPNEYLVEEGKFRLSKVSHNLLFKQINEEEKNVAKHEAPL
jgi:hypothetical protein